MLMSYNVVQVLCRLFAPGVETLSVDSVAVLARCDDHDVAQVYPVAAGASPIYGLRRELTLALLVKIILLVGLWFLIFRWQGKPAVPPPDIAAHFQLAPSTAVAPSASHPSTFSENPHDRR